MHPLFKAISNSLHSIEDRFNGDLRQGNIAIDIVECKDPLNEAESEERTLWPVEGFKISDNGVGFTEENLASFNTVHSKRKLKIGGKGFGRFTYLKVFKDAKAESAFAVGENAHKRVVLSFDPSNEVMTESFGFLRHCKNKCLNRP